MTADEIYAIVRPVWDKHPGAQPYAHALFGWSFSAKKFIAYDHAPDCDDVICMSDSLAGLICEAAMVRWLAAAYCPTIYDDGADEDGDTSATVSFHLPPGKQRHAHGVTLLHALAAACMAIEEVKP